MDQMEPTMSAGTERVRRAWDDHHERLWQAVLAWSGDADVASDAVSEAFAQALRRGDAIDDVGRWVWRAAFRIAGGLLQDRRQRDGRGTAVPEQATAAPDDLVVLLDALAQLRPSDRELIALSLVGGWSSRDIADLVGSTSGAVRVRVHRARKQLRHFLEDDHG
jgi:RNA polymerase sigma-70 factor (ECF subfamily)